MAVKYAPLTRRLEQARERNESTVALSFDEIAALVDDLPPSAAVRQWWVNGSHVQALAWRTADWRVERVYLDQGRVRFVRGEPDGSHLDLRLPARPRNQHAAARPARTPIDEPVDVRVRLQRQCAGRVDLAVATVVKVCVPGQEEQPLDLTRTAPRLLTENAAFLLAQLTDAADIENLR